MLYYIICQLKTFQENYSSAVMLRLKTNEMYQGYCIQDYMYNVQQ